MKPVNFPDVRKITPFALTIFAACFLAYGNSFSGAFLFDDRSAHLLGSVQLEPTSLVSKALSSTRPVLDLSFILNFFLGGLRVWGYHAVNFLIHLAAALTLFGITQKTLLRFAADHEDPWHALRVAFAIALIWAVHPLQTQSVTYIIQRGESLMGMFYFFTLYAVIRGTDSPSKTWIWYGAAILSCVLGMATKEVMVTAPLTVLLYDRIFLAGSFHAALTKRRVLYAGLFATWIVLFVILTSHSSEIGKSVGFGYEKLSWIDYAKTQPAVILHYLRLAFWPRPLILDYAWPVATSIELVLPGLAVVAVLFAATFVGLIRRSALAFPAAWFFLILLPTSSVVPIADLAGEHRMYLPLAGVVPLAVLGADGVIHRLVPSTRLKKWISTTLLFLVAGALSIGTIRRNRDYQSEIGIWRDVISKKPENFRAYNNVGVALDGEGKPGEAVTYYSKALELNPSYDRAHFNLGTALDKSGKRDEAVEHYKSAVRINPLNMEAHNNLAVAYVERGELDQALIHYAEVIRLKPAFAEGYFNLGNAWIRKGKPKEALEAYAKAVQLKPGLVQARDGFQRALAQIQASEKPSEEKEQIGPPASN